jgi:hypothetical protein
MILDEEIGSRNSGANLNSRDLIASLQRSLNNGPATLEQILSDLADKWHHLGWNSAQVSLWLASTPALDRCLLPSGESAWELDVKKPSSASNLSDELVALLQQAGRPMPLSQLISKLPAGRVVTEPMLRAAAQQDARLELKGPLLKMA